MSDATYRGRFVWHELLTTDTKSAGGFFSKTIGWKPQAWAKDKSYTLFLSGSTQVGGLMTLPDEARKMGAPSHWLTYVSTNDVDETARLASSLGATVLQAPEDIPGAGRYAVLQDPQGATFGIYKSNQASASDAGPALGEFSWHELATTDAKAAFGFYQRLFGWEETNAMDMGELGVYQMFGQSKQGRTLGGLFNKPPQMPGPSAWLAYIRVPDAKQSAEAIKKAGGKVINGPMEVPGGDWIAQALDPQGVMFAVHSVVAVPAAPSVSAAKASVGKPASAKASAAKAAAGKAKARARSTKRKRVPARKAVARKRQPARKAARKGAVRKGKGRGRN